MQKSLDEKLQTLQQNPDADVFVLADAKDADMGFGIPAPGPNPSGNGYRSLSEFRQIIREIVDQQLVDIMLMSPSTNDLLTIQERIFDASPVTAAARANDTSDIFGVRGGLYSQNASRPFRTTTVDHIQCGVVDGDASQRKLGANLALYSVTFNNDVDSDLATLREYREFRLEAERRGLRHFLEVFDPNVPGAIDPETMPHYVNDMIARTLAGVTSSARPLFLKMAYHGQAALEELHHYEPSLPIGILGGSAGTTHDAFKLLAEARKHGAKIALFGRKINHAENQFAFLRCLRQVADGTVEPDEAVRAYHGELQELDIQPTRSLDRDMELTRKL